MYEPMVSGNRSCRRPAPHKMRPVARCPREVASLSAIGVKTYKSSDSSTGSKNNTIAPSEPGTASHRHLVLTEYIKVDRISVKLPSPAAARSTIRFVPCQEIAGLRLSGLKVL